MEHFLTHPTMSSFACGADAVGRRNPRVQCNANNTTCRACLNTQDHAQAIDPGVRGCSCGMADYGTAGHDGDPNGH